MKDAPKDARSVCSEYSMQMRRVVLKRNAVGGVGINLVRESPGTIVITGLGEEGGVAALSGEIKTHDLLHAVDKTPVYELDVAQTMALICGEPDSDVALWVQQASTDPAFDKINELHNHAKADQHSVNLQRQLAQTQGTRVPTTGPAVSTTPTVLQELVEIREELMRMQKQAVYEREEAARERRDAETERKELKAEMAALRSMKRDLMKRGIIQWSL